METHQQIRSKFQYEYNSFLDEHVVQPGISLTRANDPAITLTGINVAHGRNPVKGAVIYAAQIENKRVVFFWDIDSPEAVVNGKSNRQIIKENLPVLEGADLLLMAANTFEATGTGHMAFLESRELIDLIQPKMTYLTHVSGHEDRVGYGHGLTDSQWSELVRPYGVHVARQGMILEL